MIDLFCDGACTGNPGQMGAGILLRFGRIEKALARPLGHGTNNIAELTAIRIGLSEIKRHDIPVMVHSDSTYAIGVLSGAMKARLNQDLVTAVRLLIARFVDVRFHKVPGHSGHPENEEVDALAVKAAREGRTITEVRERPV